MDKRITILLILLLAAAGLRAQYYDTGQEPASVKWERLESHHFSFIYPESYSSRIAMAVFSFERAYELLKGSYKEPLLGKIPVIIHNHTTRSNGYVAWAPGRVELYPYPGQDNIPMDHMEQLALHELMHVLQMHSFKRGVSRFMTYIFGEQYTGALGIFTPYWFLEGEAVLAESAWSYSGRGRTPSFEKKLKAALLDNDIVYSYDRMLFGSYRDFTPNHYQYGYQMSAWARTNFGDKIWQKPMDYTALRPYTLNPFNAALRKYTDHSKEDIYFETMVFLKKRWTEEEEKIGYRNYLSLNPEKNNEYINYYSPLAAGKDSIIAIKTSLSHIPSIVLIDTGTGEETRLHSPGSIWPYRINISGNTVVWAETRRDPRWENREYSVINTLDIQSGTVRTLSRQSRLFSPDISPASGLIAAAESTAEQNNSMVIMDAVTGEVKSRYHIPGNIHISMPSWSDDGKEIIFISSTEKGEGIMSLIPSTGEWKTYIEESRNDLQSVRKSGGSVFFVSSASGVDNAFRIDDKGEIYRLTSSRFGISDISVAADSLLFSDYRAGGNDIASTGRDPEADKALSDMSASEEIKRERFIDELDREEKLVSPAEYNLPSNYKKERYSKWSNLFRFHSWMPFYADINNISYEDIPVSPGATIMTQNNLSSLISTIGYEYSGSEHLFHSNISWKGWYPAVDFNISYGGEPGILRGSDTTAVPSELYKRLSTNTTVYLPLHFNHSRFRQTLWPSVNIKYLNRYVLNEDGQAFDYGQTLVNMRLYFSNLYNMAYRDIWPKYGQVLDLYYTSSLFDHDLYGPVSSVRTAFYFPGIIEDHGLRLRYQYEKQEFRRLLVHNRISLPRGYKHIIAEELSTYSADYALPLAYPDFRLGRFLYANRIRNTFFYDYSAAENIYDTGEQEQREGRHYYSSTGIELMADFYLLRIPVRLSAGVQAAWLPAKKSSHFELLLNMDVFGFVLSRDRSY